MAAPARQYHQQMVHFLRKGIGFADHGTTLDVGTIPAGSVILKPMSGVSVTTIWNGTAPQLLDIGLSGDTDLWATDLSLSTTTFVPMDENVSYLVSAATTIQCVLDATAATAGVGQVIVAYIPNIDG